MLARKEMPPTTAFKAKGLVMSNFTAFAPVNLPALDFFSGFSKISALAYSSIAGGFRITLSATETIEVLGNLTYSAGLPIGGSVTGITISVSGNSVYAISGIAVPWATAIGYSTSQAAALAAWPALLAGDDTLTGSSQGDVLMGYGGNDVVDGGGGVDTVLYTDKTAAIVVTLNHANDAVVSVGGVDEDILRGIENVTGGSGNDILSGDGEANILAGGAGDDILKGGAGMDVLDGGSGIDTAVFTDKTLGVIVALNGALDAKATVGGLFEDTLRNVENVTGGSGNDILTGDGLANVLDGGLGNDLLAGLGGKDVLDGGGGIDTAMYSDKIAAVVVTLNGPSNATVTVGGLAEDTLRNIENVTGGAAADTLVGDAFANALDGGLGDDTLTGGAGKDALEGGGGVDTALYTEKTLSVVVTLNGPNTVTVQVGADIEDTLRNIENVTGGSLADTLTGDDLANTLDGGGGGDTLTGGGGNDLLIGRGDADILDGGTGSDTASYAEKTAVMSIAVTLDQASPTKVFVAGVWEDTLIRVENVIGGAGADLLTGDALANSLVGGLGNDVLTGGGGADVLDGGGGTDTASYSDKLVAVELVLNGSIDTFVKVAGVVEDTIRGIENITGGAGNDILTGDLVANVLVGGGGNDRLTGLQGKDTLDGGLGADTAVYAERITAVMVTLNGGNDALVTINGVDEDTIRSIENIVGGTTADTLIGDSADNQLEGGAGDDLLQGRVGMDVLDGGAGNDTASFAEKSDTVVLTLTGAINTTATVGTVNEDTLRNVENVIGGAGNDTLTGDGLANRLSGGDGADTLAGGLGDDTLTGGLGIDTLDGGGGVDTAVFADKIAPVVVILNGGNTATATVNGLAEDSIVNIENLVGGIGADSFTGDAVANRLEGGLGADALNGADGDDVLFGGGVVDTIDGGAGIDTALFTNETASVTVALNLATPVTVTVGGANADTLVNVENVVGGSGNDALTGDTLDNFLDGGLGDDILRGGAGNDTLDGNAGNDTATYSEMTGPITVALNQSISAIVTVNGLAEDSIRNIENIIGGTKDDTLTGDSLANALSGGGGNDLLKGGIGLDVLDGGDGIDTADYAEKVFAVEVVLSLDSNASVLLGGIGEDVIRSIENIIGGTSADVLTGDSAANRLEGRAGADMLTGMAGNDALDGGIGIDTARYSDKTTAVVVTLNGALSTLVLIGADATDTDTIVNIENLIGGSAGDTLTGDGLANRLDGGAGGDNLAGADGDDVLIGRDGNDNIDGGAGSDTASYLEKTGSVVVTLNRSTPAHVMIAGVHEDTLINVENIEGGSAADSLTGDDLANAFLGAGGKDVINGGLGSDTALFTDKTLTVAVTLNGKNDANVMVGGVAEDILRDIENITGGAGADILAGDGFSNTLAGEGGNDILQGGAGSDVLDGGADVDTALFNDKIAAQPVVLTLNGANNAIATIGGVEQYVVRNIENVIGGAGDDILTGDGLDNLLDGGLGNDTLAGAGGKDVLDGGGGSADTAVYSDKILAVSVTLNGANNTTVTVGATAEDVVRNIENVTGGSAADTLVGDGLANLLHGGLGDDVLTGMGGKDVLDGGGGIDTAVYAEKTAAVVVTLNGAVNVTVNIGGQDEDTLRNIENVTGGTAADLLTGDGLSNTLDGGTGDDTLLGGLGDDLLLGRIGKDTLDGGSGIDTASYAEKTAAVSVTLNGPNDATASVGGIAEDTLRSIENLIGGSGADLLTGDSFANSFTGLAGKDVLNGGAGLDTASYAERSVAISVTLGAAADATVFVSGVAEDTISNIENIIGGSAADTLIGDAQDNRFDGGAGDDLLTGAAGRDTLDGGIGNDTLLYTDKTIGVVLALDGANDATAFVGGIAEDVVRLVENITGGSGNDQLTGDALANTLNGGGGDDVLKSGGGQDKLDGGTGIDTALYTDKALPVAVTLNGAFDATVTVLGLIDDTLRNIENITGGSAADTLTGDSLANAFMGGGGKDTLDGAGGIDTVLYSDKTLSVVVTLNTTSYVAVSVGGVAEDLIRNFENVVGSDQDDTLGGDGVANVLKGGLGNDTLIGGGGDDTLDGGGGNDTAVYSGTQANYSIAFGAGFAKISGADGTDTLIDVEYLQFSDNKIAVVAGSAIAITATSASKPEGNGDFTPFTFLVSRTGNTTAAQSVAWAVAGTAGAGTLPATASDFTGAILPTGTVTFAVGETAKAITVQVAGDIAGEFNERFAVTLSSPSAGASITGAVANAVIMNDDTSLAIAPGNAVQNEGNSASTAFTFTVTRAGNTAGSTSVNWAAIGGQTDMNDFAGGITPSGTVIFGAAETSKTITVNVAGDLLAEPDEAFAVVLYGASDGATIGAMTAQATILGDDALGTSASEMLIGTFGNDVFLLNGGNDTVFASAGADQFRFLPAALGSAATSSITLSDFDRSLAEKLDLSAIDAIAGGALNDAFSFIGSNAFTGAAGQLRWTDTGGNRKIEGDVNGDKSADLTIFITAVGPVTSEWFVL